MVPATTEEPFGGIEAVVDLQSLDGLIVGLTAFQVGPTDEVLAVAAEVAVSVHEAGVDCVSLSVNDFGGGVVVHDLFFGPHGDEFPVFHGKGLCHAEIGIDSINLGVVDDEVNRGFVGA